MVTNAGTMDRKAVAAKGTGNREASEFMNSAFRGVKSALWTLVLFIEILVVAILSIVSAIASAISWVAGMVAMIANSVAAFFALVYSKVAEIRDEIHAAFVNWKAKQDRIAAKAEQLEAQEAA